MQAATLESANKIPMLKTLGVQLVEIGDDYAIMKVTVDERHANYFGGAHGGLLATLVDTVSFFPRPLLPSGLLVTTVSLNINYLKSAQIGDRLAARSQIEHLGRRTVNLTVRITNGEGSLLAHGNVTLAVLKQPVD